jgi:hypothetical protein
MIYRVDKFQFTGVIKVAFRILSEFSTYPEQLYSRGYGIKAGLTNVRHWVPPAKWKKKSPAECPKFLLTEFCRFMLKVKDRIAAIQTFICSRTILQLTLL